MKTRRISVGRLVGLLLVLGSIGGTVRAADHRDGPRIAGNTTTLGNIDLNDVYVFRAPHNADRTVMILTVSPAAGVIGPAHFASGPIYEFRIDNNGDVASDIVFQVVFSGTNLQGRQSFAVRQFGPGPHSRLLAVGQTSIGSDKSLKFSALPGNGKVTAGLFDDPFFFDLIAFNKFIAAVNARKPLGDRVAPFLPPSIPNDFFANFNVLAIVLEVPSAALRSSPRNPNISVWTRTIADVGDGRGFAQYDRTGLPAINTAVIQPAMKFLHPELDVDNFNFATPDFDPAYRAIASQRIAFAYGVTPSYADTVASAVLPDVMPFNTLSYKGFLNGRRLDDDVIDAEFSLLSNGALKSDRVINDSVFRVNFPYLAPPLPRQSVLRAVGAFNAAEAAQTVHP